MTAPPPPRPIRRGEWVEVRCNYCGWHIVNIRVVGGFAEIDKDCPKCGRRNEWTFGALQAA